MQIVGFDCDCKVWIVDIRHLLFCLYEKSWIMADCRGDVMYGFHLLWTISTRKSHPWTQEVHFFLCCCSRNLKQLSTFPSLHLSHTVHLSLQQAHSIISQQSRHSTLTLPPPSFVYQIHKYIYILSLSLIIIQRRAIKILKVTNDGVARQSSWCSKKYTTAI